MQNRIIKEAGSALLLLEFTLPVLIIIITIIAFKGAIRDCLLSLCCAAKCLQHVRSSGQGAIMCESRATH